MSSTKHFSNDPNALVSSALRSFTLLNPSVRLDASQKVLYYTNSLGISGNGPSKVAIISGGGSGHEPAFGGFVGKGMLTAAVAGTIFASPNSHQVLSAICRVSTFSKSILVTVMNYTGDILNFGVAVEKAKARYPHVRIEMLVVADDVAVPKSKSGKVGRRGMAGTVIVHKVTGALADLGYGIDEILAVGKLLCENLVTIGVALDRVHVPGRSVDDFAAQMLPLDQVEIGMGIHNEAGCLRVQGQAASLESVVRESLSQLLSTTDPERSFVQSWNDCPLLLVNNLGGLSPLQLGAAVAEVLDQLQNNYGIKPKKIISGQFMTSLDCRGFSITLLNDVPLGIHHDILDLVDHAHETVGWNSNIQSSAFAADYQPQAENGQALTPEENGQPKQSNLQCDMGIVCTALRRGLAAVISAEPETTRYDTIVGDGDCGTTLKRGAEGIIQLLDKRPPKNPVELLSLVAEAVQEHMDGTSGAIYSIYINALNQYFQAHASDSTVVNLDFWSTALNNALLSLFKYTPARQGDRTLMDALIPFTETLQNQKNLSAATHAAALGASQTKAMGASLGRTVYVGNQNQWLGIIPDPGAWGLSKLFEGISGSI